MEWRAAALNRWPATRSILVQEDLREMDIALINQAIVRDFDSFWRELEVGCQARGVEPTDRELSFEIYGNGWTAGNRDEHVMTRGVSDD